MNPRGHQFALGGTLPGWTRLTTVTPLQRLALVSSYRGLNPLVYSRYGRRQWAALLPGTSVVKDPFAMTSWRPSIGSPAPCRYSSSGTRARSCRATGGWAGHLTSTRSPRSRSSTWARTCAPTATPPPTWGVLVDPSPTRAVGHPRERGGGGVPRGPRTGRHRRPEDPVPPLRPRVEQCGRSVGRRGVGRPTAPDASCRTSGCTTSTGHRRPWRRAGVSTSPPARSRRSSASPEPPCVSSRTCDWRYHPGRPRAEEQLANVASRTPAGYRPQPFRRIHLPWPTPLQSGSRPRRGGSSDWGNTRGAAL